MNKLRHSEPYAPLRRKAYMGIGNQLDAIYKAIDHLKNQGIEFPSEVCEWLDSCSQIKDKYPKEGR